MIPPYWIGAGILGLLFLSTKKATAAASLPETPPPPPPTPDLPKTTYGEAKVSTPFPAGYRRMKQSEVTPELLARASAIRSSAGFTSRAYGTVIPIDGDVSALIEQHYHEPEGPVRPWGYHHGVTLIRKV